MRYAEMFPVTPLHAGHRRATTLTGEATPSYILRPSAARALRELLPDVRLVAILRDPTPRAYSEYSMKMRRFDEQNAVLHKTLATNLTGLLLPCFANATQARACLFTGFW
jgi:hypothetical protein